MSSPPPSREEVAAMLEVVDDASTMGVDPVVRYPTLRAILDLYVAGELVTEEEATHLANAVITKWEEDRGLS